MASRFRYPDRVGKVCLSNGRSSRNGRLSRGSPLFSMIPSALVGTIGGEALKCLCLLVPCREDISKEGSVLRSVGRPSGAESGWPFPGYVRLIRRIRHTNLLTQSNYLITTNLCLLRVHTLLRTEMIMIGWTIRSLWRNRLTSGGHITRVAPPWLIMLTEHLYDLAGPMARTYLVSSDRAPNQSCALPFAMCCLFIDHELLEIEAQGFGRRWR